MKHVGRRASVRVLALGALVGAMIFATATSSLASPATPIMSLVDLEAKLTAGPVAGHFDTVLRGDTITHVPCTVLAITGDSGANSLILIEATGPDIEKLGGIAAGMSGSPIYIDDKGAEKIVGAVSYGDYYTLGGTGLATPIESMTALENRYAGDVLDLARPVIAEGRVLNQVVVSADPEGYAVAAAAGALIAKPLGSAFIGGLRPQSRMYRRVAAAFERDGLSVVPLTARLGSTALDQNAPYSAAFAPGAAIGALAARGDVWVGGVGTVTYTSQDRVLAFGHSAFWDGDTSLFMTNAWIDGVWPSRYSPYKLGRPGAVRGAITQDREAGLMGVCGAPIAETSITARATNAATGETASATSYMPTPLVLLDQARMNAALSAAYVGGAKLYDQAGAGGSAATTTTVVVADADAPDGPTRTIMLTNLVDSADDVAYAAVGDVYAALSELASINGGGLSHPSVLSVDVEATFSPARRTAQIADVFAVGGLKAGAANRVRVALLPYGSAATRTVEATLSIPAGVRVEGGILSASSTSSGLGDALDVSEDEQGQPGADRRTIAQAVEELNASLAGNVLTLAFYPSSGLDDADLPSETPRPAALSTVTIDTVLTAAADKRATRLTAGASPATIAYGGTSYVRGRLYGVGADATVYVYGTERGGTQRYLGRGVAEDNGAYADYSVRVSGLKRNASLRVVYRGNDELLGAERALKVRVRAKVSLTASPQTVAYGGRTTLTATVTPSAAGAAVSFEYYSTRSRTWRPIGVRTLAAGSASGNSSAHLRWAPVASRVAVRARFLGSAGNAASGSPVVTVRRK